MTPHTMPRCITAVTLMVLLCGSAADMGAQDVLADRQAAHAAAANEAIAWAGHTAELVNIGLTAREYTIVAVAMFEAANAVTGRYVPYTLRPTVEPHTSVDAAVAAAHPSLSVLWPRDRGGVRAPWSDPRVRPRAPRGNAWSALHVYFTDSTARLNNAASELCPPCVWRRRVVVACRGARWHTLSASRRRGSETSRVGGAGGADAGKRETGARARGSAGGRGRDGARARRPA